MYQLAFHPDVEGDLRPLDRPVRQRILSKIRWMAEHVDEVRHEPLTGQWAGMYKLRVGDYRVVYDVSPEKELITVYVVGHRRDVYKSP